MSPMACFAHGRSLCGGRMEWHHILSQQRLRRELRHQPGGFSVALLDPANLLFICKQHHEQVTNARLRFTRAELPESVEAFAEAHGVAWMLDREYGERKEADTWTDAQTADEPTPARASSGRTSKP